MGFCVEYKVNVVVGEGFRVERVLFLCFRYLGFVRDRG